MRRTKWTVWLIAGGAVVAALAIGVASYVLHLDQAFWDRATGAGGSASIGGPFTLVDQDGEVVTQQDFAGRLMLIYFGYTFCPDVCPTTLQTMSVAMEQLEDDAKDVAFVFVTLDPKRDTVAQMKSYVSLFDPGPVGLTGSDEQVAAAAKAYRVYYNLHDEEGDDYLVDHSSFVYLMDREGRYITHFGPTASAEQMADKIEEALG